MYDLLAEFGGSDLLNAGTKKTEQRLKRGAFDYKHVPRDPVKRYAVMLLDSICELLGAARMEVFRCMANETVDPDYWGRKLVNLARLEDRVVQGDLYEILVQLAHDFYAKEIA